MSTIQTLATLRAEKAKIEAAIEALEALTETPQTFHIPVKTGSNRTIVKTKTVKRRSGTGKRGRPSESWTTAQKRAHAQKIRDGIAAKKAAKASRKEEESVPQTTTTEQMSFSPLLPQQNNH